MSRKTKWLRGTAIVLAGLLYGAGGLTAHAQTLFGNRGPLGQQRAAAPGGGSMFSRHAGFPSSAAVRDAQSESGAFIGRSSQADRFLGRRAAAAPAAAAAPPARRENVPAGSPSGAGPRAAASGERAGVPPPAGRQLAVRPQLSIAFDYPQPDTAVIAERLAALLANVAKSHPPLSRVTTRVEAGGQVVLAGQVPDAATAQVAAALVRLQAGVRGVENRLVVANGQQ